VNEAWPGVGDNLMPLYDQVARERQGIAIEDAAFEMDRNGYPEEVYVNFSMIPMLGDDSTIAM